MDKSLEGILRISEPNTFYAEFLNYLIEKEREHSLASLSPIEKVANLANDCEFRLLVSGFTNPLMTEPERRRGMLDALSEIGAQGAERLLRAGAALFDAIPDDKADLAADIGDMIALAGEKELDALQAEFDTIGATAEISERLFEYVMKHRDRLRPE